ncbi:MAG: MlaD family protein [Candidatus Omnitrophica bacterium]|nr:MlaD family protein [Candidatus Omnitrophota bacterium]
MDSKDYAKSFLAGIFFIIGIFLICAFIFTLGKDKGLAQEKFRIRIVFKEIGGLTEGAPVRLSGVNVGTVANIDFLGTPIQNRNVIVTLNILEKFRSQFENGIHFKIITEGVLGEKLVVIQIVHGKPRTDLSQPIIGEDPLEVGDLAEMFAASAASFTEAAEQISQSDMQGVTQSMQEASQALVDTSEGLKKVLEELYDITRKSKRIFDRIEQKVIEGELFKVF